MEQVEKLRKQRAKELKEKAKRDADARHAAFEESIQELRCVLKLSLFHSFQSSIFLLSPQK